MFARHWQSMWHWLAVLVVALAATGVAAPALAGGEQETADNSLRLIPDDASFYTSMLHNREVFEAVIHSNAWAKICGMPAVRSGLAQLREEMLSNWEDSGKWMAKLAAFMQDAENRRLLGVLTDMASDEIFVYGDERWPKVWELGQDVTSAIRAAQMDIEKQMQAAMSGPQAAQRLMETAVITGLAKNAKLIAVPQTIVGFRLKNPEAAKEQIGRLERIAKDYLDKNDITKGRLKKTKLGAYEYLVLELDGASLPWDSMPVERFKELENEDGDVQKIVDQIKKTRCVVAIGLRDEYLLLSIGPSLERLEKLGQGKLLADRAELKPLGKHAGKRLQSIGYMSQVMSRQISSGHARDIDTVREGVEKILANPMFVGMALGGDNELLERIRKDVESLATDIKGLLPEAGAEMAVSYLSGGGIESYQYSWGSHGTVDGSKPLDLLAHVGGKPTAAAIARQKPSTAHYELLVKWAKTAYGYFNDFGLPKMPDEARETAAKFLITALPLVERIDKATREMLLPALVDGQTGWVIDDKLASKRFIESLGATEKPLPMAEPALIFGVSDPALLKKAMKEYRESINGLIDAIRSIPGSEVPEEFKIPEPQVKATATGTIYSFPLPKQWGVDAQIVPNMALSEKVAVVSASCGHTERLLKPTPLAAGGVLGKTDRPLAAAVLLDWARLVEAATPWIDIAAQQIMVNQDIEEANRKGILSQVHTGVEVLKVIRTISHETYFDDGALVGHTLMEVRDIDK